MKNLVIVIMLICMVGCAAQDDSIYQFAEPMDPNWSEKYGDDERSLVAMNLSVNRARTLQNQQILAEIAKRFLALEQLHVDPNDPNDVTR